MKRHPLILLLFLCVNAAAEEEKPIKVFILAGQSNMVGHGNSLELSGDLSRENVLIFEEGRWQKLKPLGRIRRAAGMTEHSFGPEIAFGARLGEAFPGERIGIVKLAVGGTGIYAWVPEWDRGKADLSGDGRHGSLFLKLMEKVDAARSAEDVELAAFVWQQGGADMRSELLGRRYLDNLKQLVAGVRKGTGAPDLPVLIGSYRFGDVPDDISDLDPEAWKEEVRRRPGAPWVLKAQWDARKVIPNTRVVILRDLPRGEDHVHWNTEGVITAGRLFAEAYLAKREPVTSLLIRGHARPGELVEGKILHNGLSRKFLLHIPSACEGDDPVPLVLVFHGGGGNAKSTASFSGFNELSRKHGFLLAYPQGVDNHWNDGRKSEKFKEHSEKIDDVGFVLALLDALDQEFAVNGSAVFATGMSNGGIFCHRLAAQASARFTAVAPVIGGIAEPVSADFHPDTPVSVLFMNGTDDPFVPYAGGEVTPSLFPRMSGLSRPASRGRVISTNHAIELWLKHNGIDAKPVTAMLPDTDPEDEIMVECTEWAGEGGIPCVVLYRIIGGGHTYPGGQQYLPERIIGRTCRDVRAQEEIWRFFARHVESQ